MPDIASILEDFFENKYFKNNIVFIKKIPHSSASTTKIPVSLNQKLKSALNSLNIHSLYSHQYKMYNLVNNKKNVVIVTPTASGKSLSYNLPIINNILINKDIKALYIFPTKALSQDQLNGINKILNLLKQKINVNIYDGDTTPSLRAKIRNKSNIIITNPDMLHSGILPNHTLWNNFFENLKYVVIDEMHIYKGVFGSHFANLIRRLKRIAKFYNSKLQFLLSSATINNEKELAEKLIEEEVEIIKENGAPRGEKYFILYNPPIVNQDKMLRKSIIEEAVNITSFFLKNNLSTITFARSRLNVELIYQYLNLLSEIKNIKDRIKSYRGGYLPLERREIEKGLKEGKIKGIISTNALELGVDIGELDISILTGYPGSISSVWQQAGRSGRKNKLSASILIAGNHPIDQYLIRNPEYFFEQPPESAIINPENIFILSSHLMCASFEIPFLEGEYFGKLNIKDILEYFEKENLIRHSEDTYFWNGDDYPAQNISLRSTSSETILIIETNGNKVIGKIDKSSAYHMLYKGAIYLHSGNQYEVLSLDLDDNKAYVKETKAQYYTEVITNSNITIENISNKIDVNKYEKYYCDVSIENYITGYKKIKYYTNEILDTTSLSMPAFNINSKACVISFENMDKNDTPSEILNAISHLLRNIIPLHILCDYNDIVTYPQSNSPFFNKPVIYIYDIYEGGIGLSEKVFYKLEDIIKNIYSVVSECKCKEGCPSCIGPSTQYKKNTKIKTIKFIETLL